MNHAGIWVTASQISAEGSGKGVGLRVGEGTGVALEPVVAVGSGEFVGIAVSVGAGVLVGCNVFVCAGAGSVSIDVASIFRGVTVTAATSASEAIQAANMILIKAISPETPILPVRFSILLVSFQISPACVFTY